ncbi:MULTISPECIES: hypothetical protein [Pseudofrankia]|uniref:hypothetical protein n=1 Tax=Pseudofrankia TaxID=2994363 RepID=UPI000234BCB5|nr:MULTISPECIES: hypothetical protein [Pseudofrankia]OHV40775.1 hypothetical protein BCD49_39540 [Pseudofrankia sp. EUN1h]
MVATCPDTTLGVRHRVLLVLGVAMTGRRGELAALELTDVTEVDEGLLDYVRISKTDQDALGAEVALSYGSHPDTVPSGPSAPGGRCSPSTASPTGRCCAPLTGAAGS